MPYVGTELHVRSLLRKTSVEIPPLWWVSKGLCWLQCLGRAYSCICPPALIKKPSLSAVHGKECSVKISILGCWEAVRLDGPHGLWTLLPQV